MMNAETLITGLKTPMVNNCVPPHHMRVANLYIAGNKVLHIDPVQVHHFIMEVLDCFEPVVKSKPLITIKTELVTTHEDQKRPDGRIH
jgi:hypothetical protein